jgi:hypothetical protein
MTGESTGIYYYFVLIFTGSANPRYLLKVLDAIWKNISEAVGQVRKMKSFEHGR